MSPAAAFHTQLSSIMEVLANTAVAEICELVDSGYSVLQLEISRSRKENEVLRRKLRLMELRAARSAALRAAVTGGRALLPGHHPAGGRALLPGLHPAGGRALLPGLHPGNEPRRSRTPGGEVVLPQHEDPKPPSAPVPEPPQVTLSAACVPALPGPVPVSPNLTTTLIKVEVEDESWSQSEHNKATDTEAPPPVTKQEVTDEGGDSSRSWASGEVSSTSTLVQNPLSCSQRSDGGGGGYECVMYVEPQLQHGGAHATHNPLGEDPGCSYAVNASVLSVSADSGGGGGCSFPFTVSEQQQQQQQQQQSAALTDGQQRALPPPPPAAARPQHPARKETTQSGFRRDGWRQQVGRGAARGKFVCSCCGKTLACLKNLKTHMRVHTGEKPFGCSLCGKCFSDSSNLKRHQNVHTGEKRYGCAHCGKRFAQSGSLKVHMTMHTDCKQFRCPCCGKMFISGGHLRRHVTVHAAEKPFTAATQ